MHHISMEGATTTREHATETMRRFAIKRPLAAFSLLYIIGAAFGYYISAPPIIWFVAAALICGALAMRLRAKSTILALVILLALPIAAATTSISAIIPSAEPSDDIQIEGTISALPQVDSLRTVVTLTDVSIGGTPHKHNVRLYIYGDELDCRMGDRLKAVGDTWLPSGRSNPGGFDFRAWMWTRGSVFGATANTKDVTVTGGAAWRFLTVAGQIQSYLAQRTDSLFPNDAALVKAMVLGDKGSLSGETTDQFRMAGLSHLLAVSGLHVGCLALILEWLLLRLRLSRRFAMLTSVTAVFLYAALIGFSPSVMRAWLMFTLVRGARAFGKPGDTLTGVAAAALVLLLIRPLSIADVGFQLSFGSVFGLIMLTDILVPRFPTSLYRIRLYLRRAFSMLMTSIAVQLMTLPIVAITFGSTPLIAPIVNLIAIPMMSVALPFAALKLLCGLNLLGLPDMLISTLSTFARLASESNAPNLLLPGSGWFGLLVLTYFALCFAASPYLKQTLRPRLISLAALPLCVIISLLLAFIALPGGLNVAFLDAGQADATVVRAERHTFVIDTGKENGPLCDYLLWTGQTPEAVFLTHPHADHAGGLRAVITELKVGTIYIPECWDRVEPDEGVNETLRLAESRGTRIVRLAQGDEVRLTDNVALEVLQPELGYEPKSGNGASMVMAIRHGGGSVMFTGDIPIKEELDEYPDIDVLHAAHHGSKHSSSATMLEQTTPAVMVVPVGRNSYGHPGQRVLDDAAALGATVYRTDECGAVFAQIEPDGKVNVRTFFDSKQ